MLKVHPCCSMCHNLFLFKVAKYSVIGIYHLLFIHLPADGHLGYFRLLCIMLLRTWVYKYLFELLSFLLGIYPQVDLLDHTVILFLIF